MNTLMQHQPVVPIGLGEVQTLSTFEDGSNGISNLYVGSAKKFGEYALSDLGVSAGDTVRFSARLRSVWGIKLRLAITPVFGTPDFNQTVSTEWTFAEDGKDPDGETFLHKIEYQVPSGASGLVFLIDKPNNAKEAGGNAGRAKGRVVWEDAKVEVVPTDSPSSDSTQSPDTIFGLPSTAVYVGGAVLAGVAIIAIAK